MRVREKHEVVAVGEDYDWYDRHGQRVRVREI